MTVSNRSNSSESRGCGEELHFRLVDQPVHLVVGVQKAVEAQEMDSSAADETVGEFV